MGEIGEALGILTYISILTTITFRYLKKMKYHKIFGYITLTLGTVHGAIMLFFH